MSHIPERHPLLDAPNKYELANTMTIMDIHDRYLLPELRANTRRLSTIGNVARNVERWCEWWRSLSSEVLPIAVIRRKHMQCFREWLRANGHSAAGQNEACRTIRQVLLCAVRHEILSHAPAIESVDHRGVAPKVFRNDLKSSGNMIDPSKLIDASGTLDNPLAPDRCYADRKNGVVVQVWENATPGCDGTPWAGTLRVSIKHTSAKTPEQYEKRRYSKPITWDDMQAIKDWFWPNRIAVEVFPPKANVVNVADMRWMWVLPQGAVLPFNLQGSSVERLVS